MARLTLGVLALALLQHTVAFAQTPDPQQSQPPPAPPQFEETIEVVAVTPIHGLGVPRDRIPANVQAATAADLTRTAGIHLGEQLSAAFSSVHVNETQSSAFQPDIQFRGFAASPLLGLPQGVAVYQDGARVNEPFGDTVNWDLLPTTAIASVNLMPGSNPLFGLNALGGAVSIQTKTGFSHPGHAARIFGGSFGRRWAEVESGGHAERLSYFVTGKWLAEEGWRDFSPSRVRQVFGNVEWRDGATTFDASVTAGINRLIGNGPAPAQLLRQNRAAVFTHPDETTTKVALITVTGRRVARRDVVFDAVGFYRPSGVHTFNGDDTTYDACGPGTFVGLLCTQDGLDHPIHDQLGRVVRIGGADPLNATNNTSTTSTRGWGGSAQVSMTPRLRSRDNHFIAGASLDAARARYESDTELAHFTETRGTAGSGILDAEAAVRLRTKVEHIGLYIADFFTVARRLTVSGSARYTHSTVLLRDQLGTALTGDHRFSRLNPAAGVTYELSRGLSAYGSFSSASRVPTPSELSCADPDDPCRLPNGFVSDPPLRPVVARTWESGIRGRSSSFNWAASTFHTSSSDDIIFVSSGALTNAGHFANIGDTSRIGLELNGSGALAGGVRWGTSYTYLRARFDTPLTLNSPNHPSELDGEIDVSAGSSIPSIPRHNFKVDVSVAAGRTSIGTSLVYTSSQFLRGDEANLLPPIDGSAIVNLTGSLALRDRIRLLGRVMNLFDTTFVTFGLLGRAESVLGRDFDSPRFLSPGAPRAVWLGIELMFP